MKVIIAGSRTIQEFWPVRDAYNESGFQATEIVSGTARGVDRVGEVLAGKLGLACKKFPADWDKYGKSAGYRRNEQMAAYADALIAVWDGESRGTAHMIRQMEGLGKKVYVKRVNPEL